MPPSTTPRDALLPDQTIPTTPNSSFAANFNPARHQRAPLCPITRAHPTEEMEEKEICQPKLTIDFHFKTMFVMNYPRNRPRAMPLSPKCSIN
jgi:hypothetical protein